MPSTRNSKSIIYEWLIILGRSVVEDSIRKKLTCKWREMNHVERLSNVMRCSNHVFTCINKYLVLRRLWYEPILSRQRITKILIRCADAQADLCLCCSHMAKAGFLMTWLIWPYGQFDNSFTILCKQELGDKCKITILIQSFRTDRSGQTVKTQIRLQEQSDQGLYCLQVHLHLLGALFFSKAIVFKF